MKTSPNLNLIPRTRYWLFAILALCLGLLTQRQASALTVTVKNSAGETVTDYRWLLEEDNTAPGIPGQPTNNTVSLIIHKSHAPVVAAGSSASPVMIPGSPPVTPESTGKRYALSVMAQDHMQGGANLTNGQSSVTVILAKHPLPTAQISVLAFEDHNPINNVPDATEPGLPGCQVVLFDFLGGPMLTDTFGNPLGTTYQFWTVNPDTNNPPASFPGPEDTDWNGNGDFETVPNGDPLMVEGSPVVDQLGTGFIYTDANGKALIKYLAMGKYGVQVIPPNGSDWTGGHGSVNANKAWNQTATIEGTLTVDAWVKANEPKIFMEGFGPGTYHAFFGFVNPSKLPWGGGLQTPTSGVTLIGTNRYNHFGRPPTNQLYAVGDSVKQAWVGLNAPGVGAGGPGLYAAPCDPDTGVFVISNVPPGDYVLVTWDKPLDALFGIHPPITVSGASGSVQSLGNVLSYRWFASWEGNVFYDSNANGFKDPDEVGIANQNLNLRWRDGTIYQAQATDVEGYYEFAEVFPFFKWLVAEVDFARFKPTGMTAVTDEGGIIPPDAGWAMPSDGKRNPQPQYALTNDVWGVGVADISQPLTNMWTTNNLSRTEPSTDPAAPLLTEAVHLFLSQNTRIDWGKINYGPGENGGISGVVGYQNTRAEEDPRLGVNDPWEPGVPRVQIVLYRDADGDKVIDDLDSNPGVTLADIDNHPLGWNEVGLPGPEDVDRNGNGTFDPGDALQIAWTDSWDDSPPTGAIQTVPPVIMGKSIVGSDNYATWNQTREGVFDGGYAFGSYHPGGIASGSPETNYLPPGMYIVQSCPPPGYLIQTEEGVNVGFGDAYKPSKLLLPPELVGTPANHAGDTYLGNILPASRQSPNPNLFTVPAQLSLFPGEDCTFAGQERPIADMKWVRVADGKNAACDFHVYTEVPKSTRVVGFVLNDLTAEFDSKNPIFGEKGSPGWLPVSFRDWTGREVARTYSDEYGSYEALVPSTYNVAAPMPSGAAPQMLTLVLNDPTMPDPSNPANRIPDPNYNPAFSTTPWTLHYYPGTFLYADTPIVPIAAFVGGPNKQLDVEPSAATPVITNITVGSSIAAPDVNGPYVPVPGNGIVNIFSAGTIQVPNPEYTNGSPLSATVARDFGFGAQNNQSRVLLNGSPVSPAYVVSWNNSVIRVRITNYIAAGSSELLTVRRGNGRVSQIGVSLTRGAAGDVIGVGGSGNVHIVAGVNPTVQPLATPIQDAIDAANPGDLVIVPVSPWDYTENLILWKPLRLQGSGLGTIINANPTPADRLSAWHTKAATILTGDPLAADPFIAQEAPGILVLGRGVDPYDADFNATASRIDGFQIKGGIAGGGIVVWDQASNLRISNNRIIGNQGSVSGGISLGEQAQLGTLYNNTNVVIEYNQILQNGGVTGAGGIGVFTGASGYIIRNNYIIGNFTRGSGAGIAHEGRSPGGLIANNVIAFNEVFYGVPAANVLFSGEGGGIFIGGVEPVGGGLSSGAGSLTIINNLIQGNLAGAGHGGGIRALGFNGDDVAASPNTNNWYRLDIFNNVIVNNVAGYAGGGISLADAARARIINNTIALNESSGTALAAFTTDPNVSTAQGAGVVTYAHSAELLAAGALAAGQTYCDPVLFNNIIWQNRSFGCDQTSVGNPTLFPNPSGLHQDLRVADGGTLHPANCILSSGSYPGASNVTSNPRFILPYTNTLYTAAVVDEAGNNISVRFAPIGIFLANGTPRGNYHVNTGSPTSPAVNAGAFVTGFTGLNRDIDGEVRPRNQNPVRVDIGADELYTANASIVPPPAPNIAVPLVGPPAEGTAPPATGLATGPNVAPTAAMAPLNLNKLPGDPLNPLTDPEPMVDSDGDGNPANDIAYRQLAAGDGWATMADGTDLYTFGFSDVTSIVTNLTAQAAAMYAANSDPTNIPNIELVLRQIGPTVQSTGLLSANIAAPTMVFKEGQHAYLDLSNVGMLMRPDLFDPHTVHFHGFPQAASIFDGEPMASVSIAMGGTLRYYYKIVEPGTYLYHCHVEATEHMQMGMIGNLWVEPKQNQLPTGSLPGHVKGVTKYAYNDGDGSTRYDVEAALQITGFDKNFHVQHIAVQPLPFAAMRDDYPMLNGRGYPDTINPNPLPPAAKNDYARESQLVTSLVTAAQGQKVLLRLSNVSETDIHSVTVLGIPMKVIAKDARLLRGPTGWNLYYDTTSVKIGGGETTDVLLDTTGVAPGTYLLYGTRLNHLSNDSQDYGGLMTEIVITGP